MGTERNDTQRGEAELIGFQELVQLLGVGRSTAARYAKQPDFPRPVAVLASGRIWRRADVLAWAARHPRRRDRPKDR